MKLTRLLRAWLQLVPRQCVVCRMSSGRGNICTCCLETLPQTANACLLCAMPFSNDFNVICGPCQINPPPWQRLISAFEYAPPVNSMIRSLKYHADLAGGVPLATGLATRVAAGRDSWPDAMVPVPLHKWRQWQRGFNQAGEIARQLHNILAIPVRTDLCTRIINTATQTGLDHRKRRANVSNAFTIQGNCTGLHLAIVDDVLTTGATMRAICSEFKKAGATTLEVWTCARVVRTDSPTGI